MITERQGNLLRQDVDALVNTVNGVGIMGKGIALQFRREYPDMFKAYEAACERGEVVPGRMHVWETGLLAGPRFIINFPTKRHWRARSRLADIESGLSDLVQVIQNNAINSIAIPPLGCGNGGLDWLIVKPAIESALSTISEQVEIRIFPPNATPRASEMINREPLPELNDARAATLALIREYTVRSCHEPSIIEVQKLVYFLDCAGTDLNMDFQQHHYGPYADSLRRALSAMEGHYIVGVGDASALAYESEPIQMLPEALPLLDSYLSAHPETASRIEDVLEAIGGFESTYGLELLATVHWIMDHDDVAASAAESTERALEGWSRRKGQLFTKGHIAAAWQSVRERELVPS